MNKLATLERKRRKEPTAASESGAPLLAAPGVRLIIKMPRQSKWSGHRIRDFERVKNKYDDRHIYKGRPLTVEEFNQVAEKVFSDTTFSYRLVPEIIAAEDADGSDTPLAATTDAEVILAELDNLRLENGNVRGENDALRTENERLRNALDTIGNRQVKEGVIVNADLTTSKPEPVIEPADKVPPFNGSTVQQGSSSGPPPPPPPLEKSAGKTHAKKKKK